MVRVFNCPNCDCPFDQGDRFCQDCGLPLCAQPSSGGRPPFSAGVYTYLGEDAYGSFDGITAPRPARSMPWGALSLNSVPAEIILVAAALAYIISAVAWCNYPQLWNNVKHVIADIPHAFSAQPAVAPAVVHAPAKHVPVVTKQPVKHHPAAAASTKSGGTEVGALFAECERSSKRAAPETSKHQVVAAQHEQKPAAAKPKIANVQSPHPVAEKPAHPITTVAVTQNAHNSAKLKLSPGEVETLARYNQMLTDYFIRQQGADSTAGSPPSLAEWISGGKQSF